MHSWFSLVPFHKVEYISYITSKSSTPLKRHSCSKRWRYEAPNTLKVWKVETLKNVKCFTKYYVDRSVNYTNSKKTSRQPPFSWQFSFQMYMTFCTSWVQMLKVGVAIFGCFVWTPSKIIHFSHFNSMQLSQALLSS